MNYDFPLSCLIADMHFDFNRVLSTPSLDKQVESNSSSVAHSFSICLVCLGVRIQITIVCI